MMTRSRLGLALEIIVPALLLIVIGVWTATSGGFYFPPLLDVLRVFQETWLFDRFWSDVVPSLARMGIGFAMAVLLGITVGVLLGLKPTIKMAVAPFLEFLRAIPPTALIPFAIAVIGVGDSMKIFIIALVCVWPVLLNVVAGLEELDPTLVQTARAFRLRPWERLRLVYLPASGPQILAGLRTSLSLALILMVISEMVASANGIGFFVIQSQRGFAIPEMWSGIILLGIIGYLLNLVLILIENRVLAWNRRVDGGAR